MPVDAELLRDFAENRSEAAFSTLVARHVDLVYAAAVRRCRGDTHQAADVSQEVFLRVARNAGHLARHPALAAWLHAATRNVALNAMISHERRKRRENDAHAAAQQNASSDLAWERLRPELDDAIDALPTPDRTAIVLRYLEARSFADIGAALKVTEDAARMRTDRALDKLRGQLAKRGITSTAAALAAVVPNAVMAAPSSLVPQIVAASVTASGTGFTALLLMTSSKVAGITVIAAAAFLTGNYYPRRPQPAVPAPAPTVAPETGMVTGLRNENGQLRAQVEQLRAENAQLQTDAAEMKRRLAVALQPPAPGALLPVAQQQRLILNNLRQLSAARDQYILEKGHAPGAFAELVGLEQSKYIRFLNAINGEDYSGVALGDGQPISVTTKDGVTVTFDPTGTQTTKIPTEAPDPAQLARAFKVDVGSFTRAWVAYQTAHNNELPKSPDALIPYFATTKEGADFAEALAARKQPRK